MTKYPFKAPASVLGLLALAGCASSSGVPASAIAEPGIAPAYFALHGTIHLGLDHSEGAAMIVAPGVAATAAHNASMVDPKSVIGIARDYDLMFFRTARQGAPLTDEPRAGMHVLAYGQGASAQLRLAHGIVRAVTLCEGCTVPAYFTFSNDKRSSDDAGPGFSGGPVIDAADGRLLGIVFGYRDAGTSRAIYAYPMARVAAELALAEGKPDAR